MTTSTLRLPPRIARLPQLRQIVRGGLAARGSIGAGLAAKAGGAAGNGLLNNLIAYWPLNEASGNRADSHGANTLSPINAPSNRAGKISNAVDLSGVAQSLTISDNAALSTGDVDFTVSTWVFFDEFTDAGALTFAYTVFAKFTIGGNHREFLCFYDRAESTPYNRIKWIVSSNGTSTASCVSSVTLAVGTWYHIVCWHDAANNKLGISIDGTVDTVDYSAGVFNSSASFNLGRLCLAEGSGYYDRLNGGIDDTAMWKSAAGGGGVLDATKRAALWNGGAGLAYASFTT